MEGSGVMMVVILLVISCLFVNMVPSYSAQVTTESFPSPPWVQKGNAYVQVFDVPLSVAKECVPSDFNIVETKEIKDFKIVLYEKRWIDFANIIKDTYLSNLRFIEKKPKDSFFESRAKIINMKSPILRQILKRDTLNLSNAIENEFLRK